MTLKNVMLYLKDEQGQQELEEKLEQFPEGPSEERAQLSLDYYKRCIDKITHYCDKKGIKYDRCIKSAGCVFAHMTKEQIEQSNENGVIRVSIDAPGVFRGATKSSKAY